MKKLLISITTALLFLGICGGYESTYTRRATITAIKGNTVYCQDSCGYLWKYEGEGRIGDNITLVMNDNHTSTITDDIITEVK